MESIVTSVYGFSKGDYVQIADGDKPTTKQDFGYYPEFMDKYSGREGKIIALRTSGAEIEFSDEKTFWFAFEDFRPVTVKAADTSVSLGAKFDAGKLLWRPLMNGLALPLRSLAAVLSYGAQKYKEDSWQAVPEGRKRYEDAFYRHRDDRAAGQVYDEESGLPHIAHMIINLMFVFWFEIQDKAITNLTTFNPPPKK